MNKQPKDFTLEDLFDATILREEYIDYLERVVGYDDVDAQLASLDMLNPYDAPYVFNEYNGIVTMNGKRYEVYECKTDYNMMSYFLTQYPPFRFYMLVKEDDVPNSLVGEYSSAEKLYTITDEMRIKRKNK